LVILPVGPNHLNLAQFALASIKSCNAADTTLAETPSHTVTKSAIPASASLPCVCRLAMVCPATFGDTKAWLCSST